MAHGLAEARETGSCAARREHRRGIRSGEWTVRVSHEDGAGARGQERGRAEMRFGIKPPSIGLQDVIGKGRRR